MPGSKVTKRKSRRTVPVRSPEIEQVSRQLASLALAHVKQDGRLGVRQREQLRRALSKAGDALGWYEATASSGDAVMEVSNDVLTMAKSGIKSLARDLADELARKRTEMAQLHDAAAAARQLAEDPNSTYPAELTYSYTARHASQDLVTKTETLTANGAQEALGAAETIEKNVTGRTKLRDQMIHNLELKQGQLDVVARKLPDFLESSREVLREVLATLF